MKNKYVVGFFIIALLSLNACTESEQKNSISMPYAESDVPLEILKVDNAPVYYVIGQSGVPGAENEGMTSNAGFVVTEKGVVVYDALGTPSLGYRLLEGIRKVTDKPISIVIAGHYHADHVYGLQAFREHSNATIWAEESAYEYIDSSDSQQRLEQRRDALFPWVDEDTYLVKPDKVFSGNKVFDMGDTKIEIIHSGPAHSPDDLIMVVHKYGVLFSGDLVYGGRLPFLGGGDVKTREWLAGLKYLQALKPAPRFIIPGHGIASDDPVKAIAFTQEYIEFLRTMMAKEVDELNTFEDAYDRIDWSKYKDVPTFSAANRRNAFQVFLEVERELMN